VEVIMPCCCKKVDAVMPKPQLPLTNFQPLTEVPYLTQMFYDYFRKEPNSRGAITNIETVYLKAGMLNYN